MLTMALGLGFVVTQAFCWTQLAAGGMFADSSAHKSFFYILTVLHAAHIVGGIAVIGYLLMRVRGELRLAESEDETSSGAKRLPRAALETGALYWHFVDALWVYVFMLLFLWK